MTLNKLVIAAFAISATAAFAGGDKHKQTQASSDSSTVKQVQQALNDKGLDAGPVDGIAGPKTQAALQKFQKDQNLSGSGSIDNQTLAALNVGGSTSSSSGASPQNDQAPPAQSPSPSMSNAAPSTLSTTEGTNQPPPSTSSTPK